MIEDYHVGPKATRHRCNIDMKGYACDLIILRYQRDIIKAAKRYSMAYMWCSPVAASI